MTRFDDAIAFGKVGESLISKWLQQRGHAVFPAYEIEKSEGKGPQLFAAYGDLVLPDILAFRNGKIIWFEAKHKTCFTWYRIGKCWETGIDQRHYDEYQEVAARTELPVWLLFWHPMSTPSKNDQKRGCPEFSPTGLFGNKIDKLVENESHRSSRHGTSGMVYWARNKLLFIARRDDLLPPITELENL